MLGIDLATVLAHLAQLAAAYLLALPIGWEREARQRARNAGLRTFPLVAVASCGFVLVGRTALGGDDAAMSRVLYGLMTGIGFIGGGAILKRDARVHGTATAASIWTTGAVGGAVGFGRYEIALALSAITFATLRLSPPLKREVTDGAPAEGAADDAV